MQQLQRGRLAALAVGCLLPTQPHGEWEPQFPLIKKTRCSRAMASPFFPLCTETLGEGGENHQTPCERRHLRGGCWQVRMPNGTASTERGQERALSLGGGGAALGSAVPGGTSRRKPQPALCRQEPGFPQLLLNFPAGAKFALLIFRSFFFFLNIYVEHHIIAEKIIVTYPRAWCTLMLKEQLLLATKVITFPCQIALN